MQPSLQLASLATTRPSQRRCWDLAKFLLLDENIADVIVALATHLPWSPCVRGLGRLLQLHRRRGPLPGGSAIAGLRHLTLDRDAHPGPWLSGPRLRSRSWGLRHRLLVERLFFPGN